MWRQWEGISALHCTMLLKLCGLRVNILHDSWLSRLYSPHLIVTSSTPSPYWPSSCGLCLSERELVCPCMCKVIGETVFVDLVHVSVCASASTYTCVQIYICNKIICIHSILSALTVRCSKELFLHWYLIFENCYCQLTLICWNSSVLSSYICAALPL